MALKLQKLGLSPPTFLLFSTTSLAASQNLQSLFFTSHHTTLLTINSSHSLQKSTQFFCFVPSRFNFMAKLCYLHILFSFIFLLLCNGSLADYLIGVNYGTVADNLPPPTQVASFIRDQTTINKIKIFDANPEIIHAFANTGIWLTIPVPNDNILSVSKSTCATTWVNKNRGN